jgi:hypothetical protein
MLGFQIIYMYMLIHVSYIYLTRQVPTTLTLMHMAIYTYMYTYR